jgi:S1-C subfamily serine protease
VLALVLVVGLGGALGLEGWQLRQVSTRLAEVDDRLDQLAAARARDGHRLGWLEERTEELELFAGDAFDPEAIAVAVLPSVFKVVAGDFTGTAFAVGGPADEGGTNLFTNYHVVEQVWSRGEREVFLERGDQRFPARIVEIHRGTDVAWLQTAGVFAGLPVSGGMPGVGQPIVSVGAPLGLDDTVTTGVVSNTGRTLSDGSGPWIQFDAAVEPGNSGGPVINAAREVVGIATRKAPEFEGIGFALPIGEACARFDVCGRA